MDKGFPEDNEVSEVVIRPEDMDIVEPDRMQIYRVSQICDL